MSDSGTQSPFGINAVAGLLRNEGFQINQYAQEHMGIRKNNFDYNFGSVVSDTVVRLLTWSVNDAWRRGVPNRDDRSFTSYQSYNIKNSYYRTTVEWNTYNNLIEIGQLGGTFDTGCPALGNSLPYSFRPIDQANVWARPGLERSAYIQPTEVSNTRVSGEDVIPLISDYCEASPQVIPASKVECQPGYAYNLYTGGDLGPLWQTGDSSLGTVQLEIPARKVLAIPVTTATSTNAAGRIDFTANTGDPLGTDEAIVVWFSATPGGPPINVTGRVSLQASDVSDRSFYWTQNPEQPEIDEAGNFFAYIGSEYRVIYINFCYFTDDDVLGDEDFILFNISNWWDNYISPNSLTSQGISFTSLNTPQNPAELFISGVGLDNDLDFFEGEETVSQGQSRGYCRSEYMHGGLPGPATSGYWYDRWGQNYQGQGASWYPWRGPNNINPNHSVTQWGYVASHALQAWNEFNFNGTSTEQRTPSYSEFLGSFETYYTWQNRINEVIFSNENGEDFLDGIYSGINDLLTADLSGISEDLQEFGVELEQNGKAIEFSRLTSFGLPSVLLYTIARNNAMTPGLTLALLAAGLTNQEIADLSGFSTTFVSIEQEQTLYTAFLTVVNESLDQILRILNFNPLGLDNNRRVNTLADLLDVSRLFPTTFRTLTFPLANPNPNDDNLAKTYYFIFDPDNTSYEDASLSVDAQSTNTQSSVGTLVPDVTILRRSQSIDNPDNYVPPEAGFAGYLRDILPEKQAVAAGAFQYTLRQVKNIQTITAQRFARIVQNMESEGGQLPDAGTGTKPVLDFANLENRNILAQGSGPVGEFTMNDFFASMSGNGFEWEFIRQSMKNPSDPESQGFGTATNKLFTIYRENYLAVQWEEAYITISQPYRFEQTQEYRPYEAVPNEANPNYNGGPPDPNDPANTFPYLNSVGSPTEKEARWDLATGQPAIYDWYYSVVLNVGGDGGGYSRGTAPDPEIRVTMNSGGASKAGANGSATVNRDDGNAGSNGGGRFGRLNISLNNGGEVLWWKDDIQKNFSAITDPDSWPDGQPEPPLQPPREKQEVYDEMLARGYQERVQIEHPPTAPLPVLSSGNASSNGQNTRGALYVDCNFSNSRPSLWSAIKSPEAAGCVTDDGTLGWSQPMNGVVQGYINQANEEIQSILNSSNRYVQTLNQAWEILGIWLKREQRSRYLAQEPVPAYERTQTQYPPTPAIWKDQFLNPYPSSILNFVDSMQDFAQDTTPYGASITVELLTDWTSITGQNDVALLRSTRNERRLQQVGIDLSDNIEARLSPLYYRLYSTNGQLPTRNEGVRNVNAEPQEAQQFTIPPTPNVPGLEFPSDVTFDPPGTFIPPDGATGNTTQPVAPDPGVFSPGTGVPPSVPYTDPGLGDPGPSGPGGPGGPGGTGNPFQPPPFGTPNDVPQNLDRRIGNFARSNLSIEQAIQRVIDCNCDCWIRD